MPHTVVTAIRTYDHVVAECHANASTTPFIQTRIDQLCVLCQSNSLILDLERPRLRFSYPSPTASPRRRRGLVLDLNATFAAQ
jgi:hypothetical protein